MDHFREHYQNLMKYVAENHGNVPMTVALYHTEDETDQPWAEPDALVILPPFDGDLPDSKKMVMLPVLMLASMLDSNRALLVSTASFMERTVQPSLTELMGEGQPCVICVEIGLRSGSRLTVTALEPSEFGTFTIGEEQTYRSDKELEGWMLPTFRSAFVRGSEDFTEDERWPAIVLHTQQMMQDGYEISLGEELMPEFHAGMKTLKELRHDHQEGS